MVQAWSPPLKVRDLRLALLIFLAIINDDNLVKSRKVPFSVIPAKAGIQSFQEIMTDLDPGFRRGDDFLRDCQD